MPHALLERGRTIRDRYVISALLASGRASATYRADDLQTGSPCVVKELSVGESIRTTTGAESYDSDDFTKLIELFEREARTLGHLEHPGIPRLIDHFSEESEGDTRLFIVQELVGGDTLEALVEGGRHFTEDEARAICRRLAEILAYIHGRSPPLVHRDIKPTNVILDAGGDVHLVDFGSVRTSAGVGDFDGKTIVGTFGYMPLEQYEGRATPTSDLYALGGTLIYLLTHRAPHELPRRGMRVDFRRFVNVSDELAEIIERMVEPDPEARFAKAEDVLAALDGRSGIPAPRVRAGALGTRPGEAEALLTRTPAASRLALALAAGVLLVGGLGGGLFLMMAPESSVPAASARAGQRVGLPEIVQPARAVDGTLTIDIYRNFTYFDEGWPMGRSTGQTLVPALVDVPRERLTLPDIELAPSARIEYGQLTLGNSVDNQIAFALLRDAEGWGLLVDTNNDEDLRNDGGILRNQGDGVIMANSPTLRLDIETEYGRLDVPYQIWMFFHRVEDTDRHRARFYARNHWVGDVLVGRAAYTAIAFEEHTPHDGLYKDAGVCIDLDRDDRCQVERELFHDGDRIPFPEGEQRLVLAFP